MQMMMKRTLLFLLLLSPLTAQAAYLPEESVEAKWELEIPVRGSSGLLQGNGVVASPSNNQIFVTTSNGALTIVDASSTPQSQQVYTPEFLPGYNAMLGPTSALPLSDDDDEDYVLYGVNFVDRRRERPPACQLLAVDTKNATLRWSLTFDGAIAGNPAYSPASGLLYVVYNGFDDRGRPSGQISVIKGNRTVATLSSENGNRQFGPPGVAATNSGDAVLFGEPRDQGFSDRGSLFILTFSEDHEQRQGEGEQSYDLMVVSQDVPSTRTAPAVTPDLDVFLGTQGSQLYAWDRRGILGGGGGGGRNNREPIWTLPLLESDEDRDAPVPAAPLLSNDGEWLFVVSAGLEVAGLQLSDFQNTWLGALESTALASPVYHKADGSNPVVYVMESEGVLHQYDAATGVINWSKECDDCFNVEADFSVSPNGNWLYYGDISGKITALEVGAFATTAPTLASTTAPTLAPTTAPTTVPTMPPTTSAPAAVIDASTGMPTSSPVTSGLSSAPVTSMPATSAPVTTAPPTTTPKVAPSVEKGSGGLGEDGTAGSNTNSSTEAENKSAFSFSPEDGPLVIILAAVCVALLLMVFFTCCFFRRRSKRTTGKDAAPKGDIDLEACKETEKGHNDNSPNASENDELDEATSTPPKDRELKLSGSPDDCGESLKGTPSTLESIQEAPSAESDNSVGFEIRSAAGTEARSLDGAFSVFSLGSKEEAQETLQESGCATVEKSGTNQQRSKTGALAAGGAVSIASAAVGLHTDEKKESDIVAPESSVEEKMSGEKQGASNVESEGSSTDRNATSPSPSPSVGDSEPGKIRSGPVSPCGSDLGSVDDSLYLDESTVASQELPLGDYLMSTIADTGDALDGGLPDDQPEDEVADKLRPGSAYISRYLAKKKDEKKPEILPTVAESRINQTDKMRPMYKGVSVRPSRSHAGIFSRRQPRAVVEDEDELMKSDKPPAAVARRSNGQEGRPETPTSLLQTQKQPQSPPQSPPPVFTAHGYYVEETDEGFSLGSPEIDPRLSPRTAQSTETTETQRASGKGAWNSWSKLMQELSKAEDQFFNPATSNKKTKRNVKRGGGGEDSDSDDSVPPPPAPRTFFA